MRTTFAVGSLLVLLVLAPAAGAQAAPAATGGTTAATEAGATNSSATAATGDACEAVAGGEQRADPDEDTLGWENGCWYDDPISVDRSDGLNDTELDAVVARSMARVEQIRELEFDRTVPVEVISREQFRAESTTGNVTESNRLHQNVKWEAMLMVNESTDAVAVQQSNLGATVGGYYSPSEERIVIVSENTSSPKMNEITLSQELFHALQDQHFDVGGFDQTTEELHNAKDGIIEGDGNYVDYLYGQRCEADWNCLRPQASGGGGGGDLHVGQYLVTFAPYSEGPEFVRDIKEEGGWEAVNAVYEAPPASTEQIIHQDKYGSDEPTTVEFEDRSGQDWRVLELENGINYAQFGEAGLFAMFWYASFQKSQAQGAASTVVVPYTDLFNYQDGPGSDLEEIGPYSYDNEATAGWDGDRLYPYVTDDSMATNETGYVWQSEWDTRKDAEEFATAYGQLLEYRGAEPVAGHQDTYRIPGGTEFADAFYVTREGSTVLVVNAPTVADLPDVRTGAAPETTPTPSPTPTPTATPAAEDTPTTTAAPSSTATTTTSPGLGVAAAVVAGLLAALLLRRRHRDL